MKDEVTTQIFYHGTAAESNFTVFDGNLIYLSPSRADAKMFGENPVLAKAKQGKPRVLSVDIKPGRVKNIDEVVTDAIFNDEDIDEVIEIEARTSRAEGYRYLEFEHPGAKDNFTARISMYPQEDLVIKKTLS
jgi:hypothetical protein